MSRRAWPIRPMMLVVAAVISFSLFVQLVSPDNPMYHIARFQSKMKVESPIFNRTLGFEKVYAINLASRTDKRDAMSLAGSLTDIDVEYIDGVPGDLIPDKALPYGQGNRHMSDPYIGSWRAHMNAIRGILEQRLSSALLLEDDVDWDVRIKSQLVNVAIGANLLQNSTGKHTHSPYGDDWDLMWLGQCLDKADSEVTRFFELQEDVTAPDWRRIRDIDPKRVPEYATTRPIHTRFLHTGGSNICTYGYAVSYTGAQKLLWALSVEQLTDNFDNSLSKFCKSGRGRCMSLWPTMFWAHHSRGVAGKNSDNTNSRKEDVSSTEMLQWPTKMNIEKLLVGRTDFVDQYPDVALDP